MKKYCSVMNRCNAKPFFFKCNQRLSYMIPLPNYLMCGNKLFYFQGMCLWNGLLHTFPIVSRFYTLMKYLLEEFYSAKQQADPTYLQVVILHVLISSEYMHVFVLPLHVLMVRNSIATFYLYSIAEIYA